MAGRSAYKVEEQLDHKGRPEFKDQPEQRAQLVRKGFRAFRAQAFLRAARSLALPIKDRQYRAGFTCTVTAIN